MPDYSYFNEDAFSLVSTVRQAMETTGLQGNEAALATIRNLLGLNEPGYALFATTLVDDLIVLVGDAYPTTDIPFYRALSLFRLISGVVAVILPGNYFESYEFYHYTGVSGYQGIRASNQLLSFEPPYLVYLAKTIYKSSIEAQTRLALFNEPIGFFVIPDRPGENYIPGLAGPSVVQSKYGQPGGGLEWTAPSPVSVYSPLFVRIPSSNPW